MRGLLRRIVEAIRQCYAVFGEGNVLPLFYEADIASGAFESRIVDHLGLPPSDKATAFLSGPPVNPGTRPNFIYSDREPVTIVAQGATFEVPPRHLVFCAQKRNSTVIENPKAETVQAALDMQAVWTNEITVQAYADLQKERVLPIAKKLEREFGYDLSHWRNAPHAVSYEPAPPPIRFELR